MESALAAQAQAIKAVRSHLTEEENERASDKLIWQRAVRFGPNTPQGHAERLRNAFAAADQYADELSRELGVAQPETTREEP